MHGDAQNVPSPQRPGNATQRPPGPNSGMQAALLVHGSDPRGFASPQKEPPSTCAMQRHLPEPNGSQATGAGADQSDVAGQKGETHLPPTHSSLLWQTWPHRPQSPKSVAVSTQAPAHSCLGGGQTQVPLASQTRGVPSQRPQSTSWPQLLRVGPHPRWRQV